MNQKKSSLIIDVAIFVCLRVNSSQRFEFHYNRAFFSRLRGFQENARGQAHAENISASIRNAIMAVLRNRFQNSTEKQIRKSETLLGRRYGKSLPRILVNGATIFNYSHDVVRQALARRNDSTMCVADPFLLLRACSICSRFARAASTMRLDHELSESLREKELNTKGLA